MRKVQGRKPQRQHGCRPRPSAARYLRITIGSSSNGRTLGYWGDDAKALAVGGGVGCAVLFSGKLKCWGYNLQGQAAPPMLATGAGTPGQPISLQVGSETICCTSVPPVGIIIPGQSTPEIPEQTVYTPSIPAQSVVTPPIPVPQLCAPGGLVCLGPFTIPPRPIVATPWIPSQPATTPAVDSVPVIGDTPVPRVPVPGVTTPPVSISHSTPTVNIAVTTTGLDPLVTTHVGETQPIGPVTVLAPTPFGAVPVTVCQATCPIPVVPEASFQDAKVRVRLTIGDTAVDETVPIDLSF